MSYTYAIGQTIQQALFGIVDALISVGIAIMNSVASALHWAAENIVPVLVTVSMMGAVIGAAGRLFGFDVFGAVRTLVGRIVETLT